MKKAFKYRLYPTRKQAETLQRTLDLNNVFDRGIRRSLREPASSGTFQEAAAEAPGFIHGELSLVLNARAFVVVKY